MNRSLRYPVGEQSFEQIRQGNWLYIDKTRYLEQIAKGNKYYFLGRPRRFGKSLFLSTLKCFFEGKRNLFKGLYVNSIDWDWEPTPVLVLDLNNADYTVDGALERVIEYHLQGWETEYGIEPIVAEPGLRLMSVIRTVYQRTGKHVVVLVDEYDKPLVKNLHNTKRFERYREMLAGLYSTFKSAADYLRLVFITGISRFGKLSIFSGLNNISDISFNKAYAGICGITETELLDHFGEGIEELAEEEGKSPEEIKRLLKQRYDGYHFSKVSPDIYNPYSLLETFSQLEFGSYWVTSGTPSILLEQLKRLHINLEALASAKRKDTELSSLMFENMDPVALFYQAGYLTIKNYDDRSRLFQLGYPNEEVTEGFYSFILPNYANLNAESSSEFIYNLEEDFNRGEVEVVMKRLQSLFADMSYDLSIEEEKDVRNVLYIVFKLLKLTTDAEYHTSDGRIDILVRTPDYIYIMELKFDKSAEEALDQIKRKEYSLPWAVDNRQIIAVGINFSSEKRRIDSWKSECHPNAYKSIK